jgi:hypothetical protein
MVRTVSYTAIKPEVTKHMVVGLLQVVDDNAFVFVVRNEIKVLIVNANSLGLRNNRSEVREQGKGRFRTAIFCNRIVVATIDIDVVGLQTL